MKFLAADFKACREVFLKPAYPIQLSQFREGRTGIRDKPGRLAEAVTPSIVVNVEVFVNKDRRVTLLESANQFNIG